MLPMRIRVQKNMKIVTKQPVESATELISSLYISAFVDVRAVCKEAISYFSFVSAAMVL